MTQTIIVEHTIYPDLRGGRDQRELEDKGRESDGGVIGAPGIWSFRKSCQ